MQNHRFRRGQQMVDYYACEAPNCPNFRVRGNISYTLLNFAWTFFIAQSHMESSCRRAGTEASPVSVSGPRSVSALHIRAPYPPTAGGYGARIRSAVQKQTRDSFINSQLCFYGCKRLNFSQINIEVISDRYIQ